MNRTPLECRSIGDALLVHPEGKLNPQVRAFVGGLAQDPEHTLVVVDLPEDPPAEDWESVARLLRRRGRSFRLITGRPCRASAQKVGQLLADRLERTVLAPDGWMLPAPGGVLFVPEDSGSGWLGFHPSHPSAWSRLVSHKRVARVSRRFPVPDWDEAVPQRSFATGADATAEPLPAGIWIRRSDQREGHQDVHRRRLAVCLLSQSDRLTVVLGCPGGPDLSLKDIERFWGCVAPDARPLVRFAPYGPVAVPEGSALGQVLADRFGHEITVYAGLPTPPEPGTDGLRPRVPLADGTPGPPALVRELVYRPAGATGGVALPPELRGRRSPVDGLPEVSPGVYRYTPDAVLEVTQSGLWLRPPTATADAPAVYRVPADPARMVIHFDAGTRESAERMRALAEEVRRGLDPVLGERCRVLPAPKHIPETDSGGGSIAGWGAGAPWSVGGVPGAGPVPVAAEPGSAGSGGFAGAEVPAGPGGLGSSSGAAGGTAASARGSAAGGAGSGEASAAGGADPAQGASDPARGLTGPASGGPGAGGGVPGGGGVLPAPDVGSVPEHATDGPGAVPEEAPAPIPDVVGAEPAPGAAGPPLTGPATQDTRTAQAPPPPPAPIRPRTLRLESAPPSGPAPADSAEGPSGGPADPASTGGAEVPSDGVDAPATVDPEPATHRAPRTSPPPPASPAPASSPVPPATAAPEPSPSGRPAPAPAATPAAPPKAERSAVRVQPVPTAEACAALPERGIEQERAWLRRTFQQQYDAAANHVARVLSESPGLRGGSRQSADDVVTDLVAVRLYLSGGTERIDGAVRSAAVGPHVPLARCVASGLRRLPSYRGATMLRTTLSEAEWQWYGKRRVVTEWAFCSALTTAHADLPGDVDVMIWSMTARRTALLDPTAPDRVCYLPGTSFKVLGVRDGERRVLLLRELTGPEIGPEGDVDLRRLPLDDIALTRLEQAATEWLDSKPAVRLPATAVGALRHPPGLILTDRSATRRGSDTAPPRKGTTP
ncbi:hypothetical protein ACFY1U_12770 [Streptomyces sp. NPDC001351]|uniref:hypothetical protein n=1 Tax=Streptomyces sp. NPDC001351 TaxID=3364564 RepID=UPI0036894184